jgi:hypothetical protein
MDWPFGARLGESEAQCAMGVRSSNRVWVRDSFVFQKILGFELDESTAHPQGSSKM